MQLYIAPMGESAYEKAFSLAEELRKAGVSVETDHFGRSLKAQMKYADKLGAQNVVVLGENELASGEVFVKRMSDGQQVKTALNNLKEYF